MRLPVTLGVAVLLFTLGGLGARASGVEYQFTLVDAFTTSYGLRECYIWDINDSGGACGTATIQQGSNITYSGFYWTPAEEKTPISISWPKGISNTWLMAGVAQIYDIPDGQFANMPLLPGTYPPLALLGINDAGTAVGYVQICNCSNSQGVLQIPYVWDAAGGAHTLTVPNAKGAARINNQGLIVGWTGSNNMPDGYLYDTNTGQYTMASSLFAGANVQTTMVDVNDDGVVVGWRLNQNGTVAQGYTWSAETGVSLLPFPPPGFQQYVRPSSINLYGEIVGSIYTPTGSSRAFVYDSAHGVRDLNALTSPPGGFVMMTATAINDQGWIVGYGYGGGGMYKSFVLTPLPAADLDDDGDVDLGDYSQLVNCLEGPASGVLPGCDKADMTADGHVDVSDFAMFQALFAN